MFEVTRDYLVGFFKQKCLMMEIFLNCTFKINQGRFCALSHRASAHPANLFVTIFFHWKDLLSLDQQATNERMKEWDQDWKDLNEKLFYSKDCKQRPWSSFLPFTANTPLCEIFQWKKRERKAKLPFHNHKKPKIKNKNLSKYELNEWALPCWKQQFTFNHWS